MTRETKQPAERLAEFETERPMLFGIAYQILGSVSEAEDAVQETWVRYLTTSTEPESLPAYLCTIVTRLSISMLGSARTRPETFAAGAGGTFGADRAAGFLVDKIAPLLELGAKLEQTELNGLPGVIVRDRDGGVLAAWVLEVLDGQIQTIKGITNPAKLGRS